MNNSVAGPILLCFIHSLFTVPLYNICRFLKLDVMMDIFLALNKINKASSECLFFESEELMFQASFKVKSDAEKKKTDSFWLLDMQVSLGVLIGCVIHVGLAGNKETKEEICCETLLESSLLTNGLEEREKLKGKCIF